mgnify:CR=1 FL=1
MFQQGPADLVSGPIFGGLKCMWFLVVEAPKSALFCVACGVHDTLATRESGLWCGSRRVGGWYCFCQHAPSDGLQGMSACHVASYYFHTERIVPVVVLIRAALQGGHLHMQSADAVWSRHRGCVGSGTCPAPLTVASASLAVHMQHMCPIVLPGAQFNA